MHPLVNFAEEVDTVLRSSEVISTAGKQAHTLRTSDSGVTRLIRIASKAFHHRGCNTKKTKQHDKEGRPLIPMQQRVTSEPFREISE